MNSTSGRCLSSAAGCGDGTLRECDEKSSALSLCVALVGLCVFACLFAKYEQEQLDMENQLQQRIEVILTENASAATAIW